MNTRKFARVVAAIVAVVLVIGVMPVMALAANFDTAVTGDYFSVISENKYNLCSGATEVELILNNADGNDRKVVHYFEVDTKNENIEVLPGYYGIDKLDPDNLALDGIADKGQYWKAMELTKTVKYYESMGYNVVGAMNTALAYDSNAPYGYMVMNGVVLGTPEVHKGAQTYLAIDAEGNCELRSMSQPLDGSEVTAISANFNWLVKDGELYSYKTVERTSSDASRSMIGIKADGSLIFCQVDGRNAPVSTGLSNYEMGEMMLALGCVNAVNCDGGGSSTFVSKREGESEATMRSVPSDGSERPTINSVILVSKAKATGEFDHAVLKSDYDFYAPGTSAVINPQGVDAAGGPAAMPEEGITWGLSDASFGTIANGVFTSNGKKGDVTIKMFYNGELAGEKTIHVVDPDVFALTLDETVLPYGKTMTIDFNCTYGVDDWAVCVDGAYTLTLSDSKAAVLVGNTLIAPNDETITGVTVTATYIPNTAVTDTLKVTYGKGSETVWNFEDGDRAGFVGFMEAKKWSQENGVNNTLVGDDPLAGQFNEEIGSTTFLADASKGDPVRNGNHALAWSVDYTTADYAGWSYNVLFNVNERVVLRDVENGMNATTLGMWLYIPEGAAGVAFQAQLYVRNSSGASGAGQMHYMFTTASGVKKNLNSCTEADIPESRWVYATIDLTGYVYVSTLDPHGTASNGRSPSFIRCYVKPTVPANLTFYLDDITLDYSSAVDDRVLPTITNPTYTTADEGVTLENGAVINGNTITFTATVADNIKLDNATGKIFVDGNLLPNCAVSGKFLVADAVTLTPGVHTVTYEIKDAMGNLARVTRTFTIEGSANVTLGGHNDSGLKPEYDSVYYVDINAADISSINKLTTTLKLQTANNWELAGMSVAAGFKVSYTLNTTNDELTLVIERNGMAIDASATTLVSIPVRLWSWHGFDQVLEQPIAPEIQYATGYCPIVTVDCKVLTGTVEYTDSKTFGAFGGSISVETMINDTVNPWHVHDAELTVLNKDVTCTEDGYANRTYCETCKSVIDWGTIYEATGHDYKVVDGKLACDCGEAVTSSGIIVIGGNTYYAVVGKLATGWIADGSNYYYMDPVNYAALKNGRYTIGGFDYSFDENGIHTEGEWVNLFYNGKFETRYSFAGKYLSEQFHVIDGKTYYFGENGLLRKGTQILQLTDGVNNKYIYVIDENGVVDGVLDYTGVYDLNGTLYYVVEGRLTGGGVLDINGSRYYVEWNGVVPTGKIYIVEERTNGLVEKGWYYIDANGFINNEFFTIDGKVHYVVNGQPAKGLGVIEVDGNRYYVNGMGVVETGKIYVPAEQTNGLVAAGYIYTDETGRVYHNEFATIDGKVLYVVDGQPVKSSASLVKEMNGGLYFVEWNGNIPTGKVYISADQTNGLTEAGWHYTDETGRFYDDEFVTIDGTVYYMVAGMMQKTGVTSVREINGNLYYIEWNGAVSTGKFYVEDKYANGLTTAGWHYTDETGRFYSNEIVAVEDGLYYLVNGKIDRTGVTSVRQINGNLYYVEWNGKVSTGKFYVEDKYAAGFTTAGWHYADATGRFYSNEIVAVEDGLYYIINGKIDRTGLTSVRELDGNLYYIEWNGKVSVGKTYVEEQYANGLTTAGWHYTDATGRFYNNEFATIDGELYYMVNGKADRTGVSAVRLINGNLYYIEWNGKVASGKIYVEEQYTNGLTKAGWHYTDATGRFYNNEFATINGNLYYMVDGAFFTGGVFQVDGSLYYAAWNGEIATNGKHYVDKAEANGLIIYGYHTFDADGKMIG